MARVEIQYYTRHEDISLKDTLDYGIVRVLYPVVSICGKRSCVDIEFSNSSELLEFAKNLYDQAVSLTRMNIDLMLKHCFMCPIDSEPVKQYCILKQLSFFIKKELDRVISGE